MKGNFLFLVFLGSILVVSSCRKDFNFKASSGNLEFSRDTVYLDTVFTNIGSATYNLKVYNRSDDDIRIPTVQLGEGAASYYRLNVDGVAGKAFDNVEILARDSIFIFIETTVDIQEVAAAATQFLYTDVIEFDSGSLQQTVALVTLVQDAVFLYPQQFGDGTTETLLLGLDEAGEEIRIDGFYLEDNELTFTAEKPYVIYGYAAVDAGKTLTIEAGARVHFHHNSGLLITGDGTLLVNGEPSADPEALENEVIFEGDRLEPAFAHIPGQWGTLWFAPGSTANEINHLTIKNATAGILTEGNDGSGSPSLSLRNTRIYNSSHIGLWGKTAYIEAENLVIGNAGQAALYCNLGGHYSFKHCTFANYWNNSFRSFPTVLIDNYTAGSDLPAQDLTEAAFTNCIMYGNNSIELLLDRDEEAAFNYSFRNCLIKFEDGGQFSGHPLYDFTNPALFENIIFNENPDFLNPSGNAFIIGEDSAANNQGDPATALEVPFDILGTDRTATPDLGAYQHIIFMNEE